jgi:hypothetical protein
MLDTCGSNVCQWPAVLFEPPAVEAWVRRPGSGSKLYHTLVVCRWRKLSLRLSNAHFFSFKKKKRQEKLLLQINWECSVRFFIAVTPVTHSPDSLWLVRNRWEWLATEPSQLQGFLDASVVIITTLCQDQGPDCLIKHSSPNPGLQMFWDCHGSHGLMSLWVLSLQEAAQNRDLGAASCSAPHGPCELSLYPRAWISSSVTGAVKRLRSLEVGAVSEQESLETVL